MKKLGQKGDITIPITVVLTSLFGVLMIYSASKYTAKSEYGNSFYFAGKQLIGFLVGLVAMVFTSCFDYNKYKKVGPWAVVIATVLLVLVFINGIGQESYGAKRWIKVGSLTLQPSEIAKFAYILFVAGYISKKPQRAKTFKGLLPILLVGVTFSVLIMLEPNMSITVCFGLLMIILLFLSGVSNKFFILIIILVILLIPILIIAEPYRLKRLSAFINPWENPKGEGYQLIQSLYGLGSGGWFGVGLFNSRQKYKFLPFSESDFILSIIGEEFGFVGIIIFFAVLYFLIVKCVKVCAKCKNLYEFLLCAGILSIFFIQVTVNALVVTGSIPPTGLPIPLVSCGNTSLIVFMSAFGVVYNISKDTDKLTL